ncbi:MAG: type B 50S ribosomal protein L31 [bacterium]
MRTAIHPDNYRVVVFEDLNNNEQFLTRSTVKTEDTVKHADGNTYPLVKVHISSASHPFFTGQEKLVDIEGRVDKFEKRRVAAAKAKKAQADKAVKTVSSKADKDAPVKIENLKTTK